MWSEAQRSLTGSTANAALDTAMDRQALSAAVIVVLGMVSSEGGCSLGFFYPLMTEDTIKLLGTSEALRPPAAPAPCRRRPTRREGNAFNVGERRVNETVSPGCT